MWYRYWRPVTELANPECVLNPDPNFPKRSAGSRKKLATANGIPSESVDSLVTVR